VAMMRPSGAAVC